MSRQLTLTVSEELYQGLQAAAGNRTMSELIEDLARPIVAESSLEVSYREMSADVERECEANAWAEGLVEDSLPGGGHAPR